MKPRSHHPVRSAKKSPSKRPAKKASAKRSYAVRGEEAVALAVGRALMRKPKVNTALLKMMRRNLDLLPL